MNLFLLRNKPKKYRIDIYILNLIILFYLFRTAIPLFKYPFLFLYFSFILYSFLFNKTKVHSIFRDFIRSYLLIFILVLIFFLSFLFSNKLYLIVFKDVINAIILVSLFYMISISISTKRDIHQFVSSILVFIISLALLISLIGLLDLFEVISCKIFLFPTDNIQNETLDTDYNFEILPLFFGILGIIYLSIDNKSLIYKISSKFLFIIFLLQIFLSGSKRGMIVLLSLVLLLFIFQIYFLFKKNDYIKKICIEARYFMLFVVVLISLSYLLFFHTSYDFKAKTLELIGTKNIVIAKNKITSKIFRYISIIDKKHNYSDLYEILWTSKFNPLDPDSGWGKRIHKTVFPLTGPKSEIIPEGAKGYLMDSACDASYHSETDISESYTLIFKIKIKKDEKYKVSVYCFVSESFDGNSVSIGIPSQFLRNGTVSGNNSDRYDLSNKGVWEKLEFEFNICSDEVEVPIYLDFWKSGIKGFSELKGYVIFAFPQYNKINSIDPILGSIGKESEYSSEIGKNSNVYHNCIGTIMPTYKDTRFDYSPNCLLNTNLLSLKIHSNNTLGRSKIFKVFVHQYLTHLLFSTVSKTNDKDPIRNWTAKIISEDTTYYRYNSNLCVDTITNKLTGPRIMRWQFAYQIFKKEYSWKQKIFGGGFDFLNWYGYYFHHDKTLSDWPHNPFLSVLLYSGIIGLLLYLVLMYKVFYYYIKYIREYYILFIFFLITFFFSFFSAGNPFDPPMMGFFVILPFFIHSVYKKRIWRL